MSQKQDKKIRQIYRRDLHAEMQKEAKERMDALVSGLRKSVRKPPRFFPKILWYRIAAYFITLD